MKEYTTPQKIHYIETTSDTMTGRGGLTLFNRYLAKIGILNILTDIFGTMRKSSKGLEIWKLFKQVFCFLFDGTSRHLTHFDHVKKDEGYAAAIEESPEDMASSHTVKRFFKLFSWLSGGKFRKVLRMLFLWRLKKDNPDVIELTIDAMVMNNDDAEKRHGVQPTYKKKKGFAPLQVIWNGKIVDGIFRGGKKHSNYGKTVVNLVTDLVNYIRENYRADVTIIIRVDAGFFDELNFESFNDLNIGFIGTGKMYKGVKSMAGNTDESFWKSYRKGKKIWKFCEFGYRCDSWEHLWRTFYTRPVSDESGQLFLDFARPENVILTNIGVNPHVLEHLQPEQREHWLKPETIIESHHGRGADELPHRGLKDFGFEQLPFKRFPANSAFYYCMLIAFFVFETYKEDVLSEVVPVTSYATTVRRKALDFAAKVVKKSRYIVLRVSAAVREMLKLDLLWERCQTPTPIRA